MLRHFSERQRKKSALKARELKRFQWVQSCEASRREVTKNGQAQRLRKITATNTDSTWTLLDLLPALLGIKFFASTYVIASEPSMSLYPRNLPPLLRLPPETLDEIASFIDMHSDLISFARASHACADLVIPQHSEYRIIRVRHKFPYMWAHLARRADLARNIREVHICERHNSTATDHFPSTLIEKSTDGVMEHVEEGNRIRNLCEALRHMKRLRVFTWSWNFLISTAVNPTTKPAHEDAIFAVLSQNPSLMHLGLWGNFGAHARDAYSDPDSLAYPVCRFNDIYDSWSELSAVCPAVENVQSSILVSCRGCLDQTVQRTTCLCHVEAIA